MRLICAIVFGAAAMLCTGCASFVTGGGPDQKIRVVSTPAGANVYVDGVSKGTTPTSITITRVDEHQVRVELAGYEPYEQSVKPGFNPWVIGNLIFIAGAPVGFIVDGLDGAWIWVGGDVTAKLKPIQPASPYAGGTAGGGTRGVEPGVSTTTTPPPAPSAGGSYLPPQRPRPAY